MWTAERAHKMYKSIMAEFVPPEMNGDHQEDLRRFVAKRKQEGGAPTDF
jgi:trimethylamine--corrinoid protein Co-methyltransferase